MYKIKTFERKGATKNGVRRAIFVGLSLILEVVLIVGLLSRLYQTFEWINAITRIVAAISVLGIYSQHKTSSMKMPWIILILVFPVAGIVLFLFTGLAGSTKKMARRYEQVDSVILPLLKENEQVNQRLQEKDPDAYCISKYIMRNAKYPVYMDTDVKYYDDASEGLEAQLKAISEAKKFIFMEYHAIEDAEAWSRIEEALVERVNAGIEVRLFYDDVGSIVFISKDFAKRLEARGIKVRVFNPITWIFKLFLNNRDHRKITVIDGKVGFTGGYNLANEYFNLTHPYGQWKDTGIRIKGAAVNSLTVTFLEMWNAVRGNDIDDNDYEKYITDETYPLKEESFVQPYADSPMDDEHVGEEVYISIINQAKDYCYFMTPYMIITDEMTHAMNLAAKRGVDVRIITPGIPDKKIVYSVTRSFYNALVINGVRIYEWTPGFCHAKMCVSDDRIATVGTINLDYRSLYHHFENGCIMYGSSAIMNIKKDFLKTFEECRDVTGQYKTGRSQMLRLGQLLMRLFAELL